MKKQTVIAKISATSANLGAGYDCLGIAFDLFGQVKLNFCGINNNKNYSKPYFHMCEQAAKLFFKKSNCKPFTFQWQMDEKVPVSRGLGSSVVLRLGILAGLNEICEKPFNKNELFKLCTELEGHPDNVAPAVFGGFVVANHELNYQKFAISNELRFVFIIPQNDVSTDLARKILPKKIRLTHAVKNIANASLITAGFATQNYDLMKNCFSDFLHQPYRKKFNPFLEEIIQVGEEAGAIGTYLSGSGSGICAICYKDKAKKIEFEMKNKLANRVDFNTLILKPNNGGFKFSKV